MLCKVIIIAATSIIIASVIGSAAIMKCISISTRPPPRRAVTKIIMIRVAIKILLRRHPVILPTPTSLVEIIMIAAVSRANVSISRG